MHTVFRASSRFLWDAAYATFHGTSDGKSVGGPASFGTYKGVAAKRDSDFVTADNNAVPRRGGVVVSWSSHCTELHWTPATG